MVSGLSSIEKLSLSGNCISSLQPLSGMLGMQVLGAAHNQIQQLEGLQVGLACQLQLQLLQLQATACLHVPLLCMARYTCMKACRDILDSRAASCQVSRGDVVRPMSSCMLLGCPGTIHTSVAPSLQGLSALRVLDVSGNQLRRVEVLSACRGLGLLTQLQLSGNPLQEAQNARLHVVHMLTQVGSSSP